MSKSSTLETKCFRKLFYRNRVRGTNLKCNYKLLFFLIIKKFQVTYNKTSQSNSYYIHK